MTGAVMMAAILAGGASRRMGTDKASLRVAGETLLERTARIAILAGLPVRIIGRDRPADWNGPEVAFARDRNPGSGPLGAILDALDAVAMAGSVVALPCDMPGLTSAAIRWLLAAPRGAHGVIATRAGQPEPLCGIYAASVAIVLADTYQRGERSCVRALATCEVAWVEMPRAFHSELDDCDTPLDWDRQRVSEGQEPNVSNGL
jgi:molybdopterin-guanine dinucleotide biosynthesis protein A